MFMTYRTRLGLVSMKSGERILAEKDKEYGTYAQTLDRDGYMHMEGRPPFNYSVGTAMRKAGFLSTGALLDSSANPQTIFKQCKTVRQCFKDEFTHHDVARTRKVSIPANVQSYASPQYMREWMPSDAANCGIFGVWLADNQGNGWNLKCPGTTSASHFCCAVDVAVAPLFYLFKEYPSVLGELDAVCNVPFSSQASSHTYPIFSRKKIKSLVEQIGGCVFAMICHLFL